jgi:archaemetzincin
MNTRAFPLSAALALCLLALPSCRTAAPRTEPAPVAAAATPAATPAAPEQRVEAAPESLRRALAAVRHMHRTMREPRPGDWLETFPEPGQTFEEYLQSDPVRPSAARRTLYVQPLGEFTPAQRRVVALAADFMSHFFNLPVRLLPGQSLPPIPEQARRVHPEWGDRQILAAHVTMNVLRPSLPADAAALIAFTSSDLYPGGDMNYVFGQASFRERVGVWSLYRLGKPDADGRSFRQTLLRTLKIATHETGHMFSIKHCTKYECVMSGTNGLHETDRRPLDACPECMAKICWATGASPRERYERLARFCAANGLDRERRFFEAAADALKKI